MDNSEQNIHKQKNQGYARIEPYTQPAGGWGALLSVARNLKRQDVLKKGSITLLNINQPTGFDCPRGDGPTFPLFHILSDVFYIIQSF